jgi:hypothetical protein
VPYVKCCRGVVRVYLYDLWSRETSTFNWKLLPICFFVLNLLLDLTIPDLCVLILSRVPSTVQVVALRTRVPYYYLWHIMFTGNDFNVVAICTVSKFDSITSINPNNINYYYVLGNVSGKIFLIKTHQIFTLTFHTVWRIFPPDVLYNWYKKVFQKYFLHYWEKATIYLCKDE